MCNWTSFKINYDERLLSMISKAFQLFWLPNVPILENTRTWTIVSMFSQDFSTSGGDHDKFKEILNKMQGRGDATDLD